MSSLIQQSSSKEYPAAYLHLPPSNSLQQQNDKVRHALLSLCTCFHIRLFSPFFYSTKSFTAVSLIIDDCALILMSFQLSAWSRSKSVDVSISFFGRSTSTPRQRDARHSDEMRPSHFMARYQRKLMQRGLIIITSYCRYNLNTLSKFT